MSININQETILLELEKAYENVNQKCIDQAKYYFETDSFIFNELNTLHKEGKRRRGLLTLNATEAYQAEVDERTYTLAALVEFTHLALLIHDDVMDKSPIRRNTLSAPGRFTAIVDGRGVCDSEHQGNALALGLGDLMFFFIFQEIFSLHYESNSQHNLTELFSRTLYYTARGQMFDTIAGECPIKKDDIIKLYEMKTGYYSFFLPLAIGAHLGEADSDEFEILEFLSKHLGILLQIKDDLNGLHNDEKDLTRDISQNKAMLWRWYLESSVPKSEKRNLKTVFGAPVLFHDDIAYIQNLCEQYRINKKLEEDITTYTKEAHNLIRYLNIPKNHKKKIHEFINEL